jgi:hypothetical protein
MKSQDNATNIPTVESIAAAFKMQAMMYPSTFVEEDSAEEWLSIIESSLVDDPVQLQFGYCGIGSIAALLRLILQEPLSLEPSPIPMYCIWGKGDALIERSEVRSHATNTSKEYRPAKIPADPRVYDVTRCIGGKRADAGGGERNLAF